MKRHLLRACLAFGLLAAPQVTQAQAPRPLVWGDTLPATLDPHAIFDVPSQFVLLNVYDGLYRYQGNPPRLEPWLAESHTVSADGLTWDFTLREGLRFSAHLAAQDLNLRVSVNVTASDIQERGFADEIASGASLVMGQGNEAQPVVLMRGLAWSAPANPASELVRPAAEDMFR
jgi:ABC-type oligopeptide transport system substrate-binding subunit